MISISKVLHGLELLVNDTDTGFVCPVDDTLDVFGALAHRLKLLVEALGGLDCGLRVEFGWEKLVCTCQRLKIY